MNPLALTTFAKENKPKSSFYQIEWFNLNKLLLNPILLTVTLFYFYSWLMDAGIFFFDSIQSPHGLWDAWSCWNLVSKIIFSAPTEWPGFLHQMNSVDFHPDYPLLQRGFIARTWLLIGNESVWIPALSAFVFTFCTIGLVSSAVTFFSNKTQGLIAGLILLCTPFFMIMGDSQYADNTVGFFYLATIVFLTFARKGETLKPQLLIAAGVMAGFSAWSKNEGLLFIVCLFASQLTLLFSKNYRQLFAELKYVVYGMLPILLLLLYFKVFIVPPNQIVSSFGDTTLVKLTNPSRYAQVIDYFIQQFKIFGKWEFNPWWLFLAGFILNGMNIRKNSLIPNLAWLILMVLGFFFVEIMTPYGLSYYLIGSVHRLFFQLFPTFIFIYFVAINSKPAVKKTA